MKTQVRIQQVLRNTHGPNTVNEQVTWVDLKVKAGDRITLKPKEDAVWTVKEVYSSVDDKVLEEQAKGKRTQGASLK